MHAPPPGLRLPPASAAAVVLGLAALGWSPARAGEPSRPAGFAPGEAAALAAEVDGRFRDMLRLWLPRAVDPSGGFLESFRRDWAPGRETGKFLVYQARMTWVAAEAAGYLPERREEMLGIARHGIAFLSGPMRDREHGAVHFRLDRRPDGTLVPGTEKHAYGLSFAVYAASAAYAATKDPAALDLAREVFRWLEAHAHDGRSGGYFESLSREGKPAEAGGETRLDGIGTLVGLKTMNSHIHLLEAFTALYRVWPDPLVRERLEELLEVVRDRVAVEPGCLNLFFTPDWRPVPAHDSFGHDIETAYLLAEATEALGRPDDPATWKMARRLVDHALEWGFDAERGGFFEKGEAFAKAHDTMKVWWTQAEGLNALLLLHERHGKETGRYLEAFRKQWGWIRDHQIDAVHGGWFPQLTREGAIEGGDDKASPWKAAYHDGRALMNCARMLRGNEEKKD